MKITNNRPLYATRTPRPAPPPTPVLFLSDLDGTWLSPDAQNRQALDQGIQNLKKTAACQGIDLQFGYVSARPLSRIEQELLPASDWVLANNGAYIFHEQSHTPARDWESHKQQFHFQAQRAFELAEELLKSPQFSNLRVESVGQVVGNPDADACPDMAGICIPCSSLRLAEGESAEQLREESFQAPRQVLDFAQALVERLSAEGAILDQPRVYPFHGKPYLKFDLSSVDKGDAIEFLRRRQGIHPEHVIIAGDGGNDIAMMLNPQGLDDGRRAIVVGPNSQLRAAAGQVAHALLQEPAQDCSLAVLDGIRQHLGEIAQELKHP